MTDIQHPHHQLDPTQQLSHHAYYQLIHTLCSLLPPPLTDTPEAVLARNQAAIAKVAALAPVNADEADIAAHCVCARAHAQDVMRLARIHAGDIQLLLRLTAQYALMERTGVSLRTQLLRVQTARQKRETSVAAARTDEWTSYIAAREMQQALDPAIVPGAPPEAQSGPAQSTEPPPALAPVPSPVAPLPAQVPAAKQFPTPAPQPPQPPLPAESAAAPPPPAPQPPATPSRRHGAGTAAQADAPSRGLAAEADHYARVYPYRARSIRQYGGLPPDCSFGPPDDDLVRAIVTGTSQALRDLDGKADAAA